jgi:hypothetical protein
MVSKADRVHGLEGRHDFAAAIDLDRQAPLGGGADELGQLVGAGAQARKVLGPGGLHAPFHRALSQCRLGEARGCRRGRNGRAGDGRRLEKFAALEPLAISHGCRAFILFHLSTSLLELYFPADCRRLPIEATEPPLPGRIGGFHKPRNMTATT